MDLSAMRRGHRVRLRFLIWCAVLLVMFCLFTPLAVGEEGQATTGPQASASATALPTYARLFMFSPVINGIIAGLSVLAMLLFVFFMVTISTASMAPASFVDDVNKLVIQRDFGEATSFCRRHRHVFAASIIQRCVENSGKPQAVIMEMLDAEGRRRADMVWNRISYLADVSNLAPMLGLLGTVRGMIKAFFSLKGTTGSMNAMVLAESIGEAMATTMFGLGLAILALIFYSIVKARLTRALADVEQVVHSVADHIKREDDEGPPDQSKPSAGQAAGSEGAGGSGMGGGRE